MVAASSWREVEAARLAQVQDMSRELASIQERRQRAQIVFTKELELKRMISAKVLARPV
jgi:hypothetical protein